MEIGDELKQTSSTMKKLATTLLLIGTITCYSQATLDDKTFDFWVGVWKAEWTGGSGINTITKTLDNKVIQENFEITEGQNKGFKGTSISVFNPRRGSWHQAWADNNGGYFNFIGEINEGKKMFKTIPIEKEGKVIIQRMVFYDFKQDSFTWVWESTQDGGKSWQLNWRINYSRM